MRIKTILLMSLIFPLIGFYSCKDTERGDETEIMQPAEKDMEQEETSLTPDNNNIIARLKADEELETFTNPENGIFSPRMDQPEGPFTIFAPINTAYDRLEPEERIEMDAASKKGNKALFEYYMVDGELTADWLTKEIEEAGGTYLAQSRQGEDISFTLENNELILRDPSGRKAKVVGVDTTASGGVIYKIDNVLRPKDWRTSEVEQ